MTAPPMRAYALVAGALFCAFAGAVSLNPSPGTWLGAGLAAVSITAVAYAYIETRVTADDFDPEEMFE